MGEHWFVENEDMGMQLHLRKPVEYNHSHMP